MLNTGRTELLELSSVVALGKMGCQGHKRSPQSYHEGVLEDTV